MKRNVVFEIRDAAKALSGVEKINKLKEGVRLATNQFKDGFGDEWTKKAFAWVLIDLCKEYVIINLLNEASSYFNQLTKIRFYEEDEIILNQIQYLRPKIDRNYAAVKKIEDYSKSGKHSEAFALMKQLISEGKLLPIHHESYGWVIYRYIKSEIKNLDSIKVRTYLRDYMQLQNERPSMLHSMILNFGLNYSKEHSDFDLYKFFLLWNPEYLRDEDKQDSYFKGKNIPSLLSRVFREFIAKEYPIELSTIFEKVKIERSSFSADSENNSEVSDLIREPLFWKLYNLNKDNKTSELWKTFEKYIKDYSVNIPSEWHSKILSLAERFMTDNNSWRFFNFFKDWNPVLLRKTDWGDVVKEEKAYKGIGVKALKISFEHLKNNNESDIQWLIDAYDIGLKYCVDNEWIKREKALLHARINQYKNAIAIYKELAIDLYDKTYFWHEFSSLIKDDNSLKASMLCKAALLEKNDDFLGDVRLELAHLFKEQNLSEKAGIELQKYKDNRIKNKWKLSSRFEELSANLELSNGNNLDYYKNQITEAEEYVFSNIPWTTVCIVDTFKDKTGKSRSVLSNGSDVEFMISSKFFSEKKLNNGQVFDFKLKVTGDKRLRIPISGLIARRDIRFKKKEYRPLIYKTSSQKDWFCFDDTFAIVDYLNTDKGFVHAITFSNEEIFFKANVHDYKGNEIIKGKLIKRLDDDQRKEFRNVTKYEDRTIIDSIESHIALVDGVNELKKLFHFIVNSNIAGIVRFNETDLRPNIGDFVELRVLSKIDKKRNVRKYKVIQIKETEKCNESLIRETSGQVELKYKDFGQTMGYYDLDEDELAGKNPDFAFIGDYYIPKHLLIQNKITSNCQAKVKVIKDGIKWKVIELIKI